MDDVVVPRTEPLSQHAIGFGRPDRARRRAHPAEVGDAHIGLFVAIDVVTHGAEQAHFRVRGDVLAASDQIAIVDEQDPHALTRRKVSRAYL